MPALPKARERAQRPTAADGPGVAAVTGSRLTDTAPLVASVLAVPGTFYSVDGDVLNWSPEPARGWFRQGGVQAWEVSGDGSDVDATPGAGSSGVLLSGRYDVGPLVGLGGTARVYRAWDRVRGCAVAVKVLECGSAPAPGRGGTWELKVLSGLRHPGLVGVHDAGVDAEGHPFVVMDLVDGGSLASRLQDGPLPAATVMRLGAVIADALAHVHAGGVVHRDVKPSNVLLDGDDSARLTDFGIARILDATRVTATGVVVGTAAFMAPEQVRCEHVGPAADVYALGLVLLEAVTGRREYDGGAVESALARLHRAPRVPADVPDPLASAVRRMTVFEPTGRPSASDVAAVLSAPPVPETEQRTPNGRRLAPVAALACLVTAVLGGGLMVIGTGSSPGTQAGVAAQPAAPQQAPLAAAVPVTPEPQAVPEQVGIERGVAQPAGGRAAVPLAVVGQKQLPVLDRQGQAPAPGDARGRGQPGARAPSEPTRHTVHVQQRGDRRVSENDQKDGDKSKHADKSKDRDTSEGGSKGESGKKHKDTSSGTSRER
jgi:eukaryotic-like serine/threonine-protein kinase